ncbi:MAG TPA: hypothetical protein VME21_03190 [Steroidobacteraceae bacterium]|nr:hypothetical protein [Steroidobacteraceae bacterium]
MALVLLAGCAPRLRSPQAPSVSGPAATQGTAYAVVSAQSLLSILVYRSGPLASLGHNHVIASHALAGEIDIAAPLTRSACELRLAADSFTVDEPALRAQAGADFAAAVPEEARAGTRQNLLGPGVLAAAAHPLIEARCAGFESSTPLQADAGELRALLQVRLRGLTRTLTFPIRYRLTAQRLEADGELDVRQSELGLTPFSILLGALRVRDEMSVRLHVVAVR